MTRRALILTLTAIMFLLSANIVASEMEIDETRFVTSQWTGGLIIDHTCIDLNVIPSEYIDDAQDDVKIHYAHTSHGGQITEGLSLIESDNATFGISIASLSLPTATGALCIYDGNSPHTYITPDLYWEGASARAITQNTINSNPSFTVSLWSWCCQVNDLDETGVQAYLDAMTMLEAANPSITFVYMTGNAQATGGSGYNRWVNNEMIRQYCIDNDKVLFDFADLDAWSNGVQHTYSYNPGDGTVDVPSEHPDFNGDEAAHTTYSSCEQKGRAFWWLVASLAGWNAPDITTTSGTTTTGTSNDQLQLTRTLTFVAIAGVVLVILYAIIRKIY